MMNALATLLLVLVVTESVMADVPRRPDRNRYNDLVVNSPFTSKPPPPESAEAPNPLEDYALGGVSKLNGGYYVILFDKKKAGEKKVIRPGSDKNEFEVQEVKWSDGSWKDTTVVLKSKVGGKVGTVGFDEKLLTVKAQAKAPTKKPNTPAKLPKGAKPPTPQPGQKPARTPRPRVVVPQKK